MSVVVVEENKPAFENYFDRHMYISLSPSKYISLKEELRFFESVDI